VAPQNQFEDQLQQPSAEAPPTDEANLDWVLVPVTQVDHDRRRQKTRLLGYGVVVALVVLGGWIYKRSVDPIRALEAFDVGERLAKTAHYQQAIVSYDRAISLKTDFADAYSLRGRANAALAKPQLAIEDFNRVLGLRPRDTAAFLDRGMAHLALEEFSDAVRDFDRAIAIDPQLSIAYNLRGSAIRTMGDPQKALADFNRAVALNPDMDNLFQRGATYQLLGNHEAAILDFSQVISFVPNSGQAYFARALSFRALGDLESAQRDHRTGRILDFQ
jgi:tetratricopeptide (TPR) repeat protein